MVSNGDIKARGTYNWHDLSGPWFDAFPHVSQFDGVIRDTIHVASTNCGTKMLSLIDCLATNEREIRNLYHEIRDEGIDREFLRKNKRYNALGFALEASAHKTLL